MTGLLSGLAAAALESAFSFELAQLNAPLSFGWRFVRTPHPQGGKEIIGIMHTAEMTKSDSDFAGIWLRCAEKPFEVLIILVRPLPPAAKAEVTLSGPSTGRFAATVLPPGTSVLLPDAAAQLFKGPLRGASAVSISINSGTDHVKGEISLAGLGEALDRLATACISR